MTVAHALATALTDCAVRIATHVPGHGATQTFEAFRSMSGENLPVSFHEEAAYAIAHGAALTGTRSACIIKSHGFTKALNAITDSLSCGTTAALVTIIFEDKTGSHSDNIIEVIPMIEASEMPHIVGKPRSIYWDVIDAIMLSEQLSLPVAFVVDAAYIDDETSTGNVNILQPPTYVRDPLAHVVCPLLAPYQREVLIQKIRHEDWRAVARPEMPIIPASLPPAYQAAVGPYIPLFDVFKDIGADFVCGDAGVSTLSAFAPHNIAHAALYMGGSIPTVIGASLSGKANAWSFIGDFSFISAGHYGLIEAVLRNAPINVLIYANGKAQTTGGQSLDLELLERLLAGYGEFVTRLDDPKDSEKTRTALMQAASSNKLSIVVANFV